MRLVTSRREVARPCRPSRRWLVCGMALFRSTNTVRGRPMQIRKLAAGDRLLDYRILEKIGEGGFDEVFRAEHEVLGRIVAIKVPRDLEALSALRLEGVIQATLDHPAIVRTLEISISHD